MVCLSREWWRRGGVKNEHKIKGNNERGKAVVHILLKFGQFWFIVLFPVFCSLNQESGISEWNKLRWMKYNDRSGVELAEIHWLTLLHKDD